MQGVPVIVSLGIYSGFIPDVSAKVCLYRSEYYYIPVLDVAEAQVEADGLGQQGQQRSLLQLVVQDGCVTLTPACAHIGFPLFVKVGVQADHT